MPEPIHHRHDHVHGLRHRALESMLGLAHRPQGYERFADRVNGRLYRRVVADVVGARLPAGARVLDVGTGPGSLPLLLAAEAPHLRVEAVDLAPEMIDRARDRARSRAGEFAGEPPTFTVADVVSLPFPDASVDLVVSTLSQHHWSDPGAGFRDLLRVLRPGGAVWVYDVRWSLRRARDAALRTARPDDVRVESPLPGTPWFTPVGRVVVRKP